MSLSTTSEHLKYVYLCHVKLLQDQARDASLTSERPQPTPVDEAVGVLDVVVPCDCSPRFAHVVITDQQERAVVGRPLHDRSERGPVSA